MLHLGVDSKGRRVEVTPAQFIKFKDILGDYLGSHVGDEVSKTGSATTPRVTELYIRMSEYFAK